MRRVFVSWLSRHVAFLAGCVIAVVCLASCSEDGKKSSTLPEPNFVAWNIPDSYDLVYGKVPVWTKVSPDGKVLVCNYLIRTPTEIASAACVVDLRSGKSKWFPLTFQASVLPVRSGLLGVFPRHASTDGRNIGYFFELDSLHHSDIEIPQGFPVLSNQSDPEFLAVVRTAEDEHADSVWLCNVHTGKYHVLSASDHGLHDIQAAISKNRLVIVGEVQTLDESVGNTKTQLWRFPPFERIGEYDTREWITPREAARPAILGRTNFWAPLGHGRHAITSLETGKIQFYIGHRKKEASRVSLGQEFTTVVDDCGYVQDTGVIVCLEVPANPAVLKIRIHNANTGGLVKSIAVSNDDLEMVETLKIDGEWVLLCGYVDPKEDISPSRPAGSARKMRLVPYRLNDLAKGERSINIMWNGLGQPQAINGHLIAPMNDHALIIDLREAITF